MYFNAENYKDIKVKTDKESTKAQERYVTGKCDVCSLSPSALVGEHSLALKASWKGIKRSEEQAQHPLDLKDKH